jgi:hypothetical protein
MSTGAPDSYGSRSRLLGLSGSENGFRLVRFQVGCANPRESLPSIHSLAAAMVKRARRRRRSDGVRNHSQPLPKMGCSLSA